MGVRFRQCGTIHHGRWGIWLLGLVMLLRDGGKDEEGREGERGKEAEGRKTDDLRIVDISMDFHGMNNVYG